MAEALRFRTRPHEVEAMRVTGKEDVARQIVDWINTSDIGFAASVVAWRADQWGADRWGLAVNGETSTSHVLPDQWVTIGPGESIAVWDKADFEFAHVAVTDAVPVPVRPIVIAPSYSDFRVFCLNNDIAPARAVHIVEPNQLRGIMNTTLYIVGARPEWLTEEMLLFGRLEVQEV